ncbi:MAG TPA: hypothetical protein VKT80_15465 [Chloroflexota bacterium]|nr:hypothetical protein [Chloroflexota bacterium]
MCERLAVVVAFQLFGADGFPVVVDGFDGVVWELVDGEFEVFCPEAAAGFGCELLGYG